MPPLIKDHAILPLHEFYKSIKGSAPSGQLWEAYKSVLLINSTMYRVIVLPPGTPRDAVNALRAAVAKLAADKSYYEEAAKLIGDMPEYVVSDRINEDVRAALSIKADPKAFMDAYAKRPVK